MLYRVGKFLFKILFYCFFKIEVKGRNIFPRNKPFILASNHLSYLDPIILGVAAPCRLNYLAKEELFRNKLFGMILKRVGVIPLERGKTDIKAMRIALKILKEEPLLIFPQGSRSGGYDEFKKGVGFLYKKTKAPIIAAKIEGTDKILPKGSRKIKRGKVRIVFERIENTSEKDSYQEVAQKVIERIRDI